MFKWLMRKQIDRAEALENYLDNFSELELSHMYNLSLIGLALEDAFLTRKEFVKVISYIYSARAVRNGPYKTFKNIKRSAEAFALIGAERTKYQFTLFQLIGTFKGYSEDDIIEVIRHLRLDVEEMSAPERTRLVNHCKMIGYIFKDGQNAEYLPELDQYGQGRAWGPSWRN
jgi:hypothetical protein